MEGSKLLLLKGNSLVRHTAGMWRFFALSLLASAAVLITSTLYLIAVITLWFCEARLLMKPSLRPITVYTCLDAYRWATTHILAPKWPYLMGTGLLLGLGLAGYEFVLHRVNADGRNIWPLVLNIFWFGLYVLLLTAPLICAFFSWGYPNGLYRQQINFVIETVLPWSGVLTVCLAGEYFLDSSQVFSPKTAIRRIRYGRFDTSTSAN